MDATAVRRAAGRKPLARRLADMSRVTGSDVVLGERRPDAALVEAIAHRVVELLAEDPRPDREDSDLIDAAELARRLGMDRSWVYSHAMELGAVRLGDGPNARLRFDPGRAEKVLRPVGEPPPPRPPRRPPVRRRTGRTRVPLLPVRGTETFEERPPRVET
jgi:hypothetical protein